MTSQDDQIIVWGGGEEARDLLYIDDLVTCVEAAIDRQEKPFGLYNIGYGEAFAVKDVVARIIAASGRDLRIKFDRTKPTIKTSLFLDCAKAQKELGWERSTLFSDGIEATIRWYNSNSPY